MHEIQKSESMCVKFLKIEEARRVKVEKETRENKKSASVEIKNKSGLFLPQLNRGKST
jgi:hypothetical protein